MNSKSQATTMVIIVLLVAILIVGIIIAIGYNRSASSTTGNVVNTNNIEQNPFNIKQIKITPGYIAINIVDEGVKDYNIDEINVPNCGTGHGGTIYKNELQGHVFNVVCDIALNEGSQIDQEATIRYTPIIRSGEQGIQKFRITGSVMSRKCWYNIYGWNAPLVSGKCQSTDDCINHVSDILKQYQELNSNDVTVLYCDFAN